MSAQGTLFVVGTPLGNLGDLSPRAAACLAQAHTVYAEDTRRSRIILEHLALKKPLRSLHAHNEQNRAPELIEALARGEDVALLTDAGTPAVSDPGAEAVAAAHAAGFKVSPVAGPSALTAALSVAGFFGNHLAVLFVGFLPNRGKERGGALQQLTAHEGIVVLFEAPQRLVRTLEDLAELTPARQVCMCREMTKMYEEVRRGSATELLAWARQKDILGEISLVCGPNPQPQVSASEAAIDAAVTRCLRAGLSPRDTASAVAAVLDVKRRTVYSRCLQLGVDSAE